jgi:flagellar biosynthesis/type III secretory pathway M-ring protein FliF/YscJ
MNMEQSSKENASLKTELNANLELQAQNERAVNLALDEFTKKFEEQNKTMEGVQTTLDKQWSQQLILFGILFLVFITAVLIAVKVSTKKALEKSRLSWEEFNAYVMRRTGDG